MRRYVPRDRLTLKGVRRMLHHPRAGGPVHHNDGDISWTATEVIDSGQEPSICEIGLLDVRGIPLLRINMPITQKMGFYTGGNRWTEDVEEYVTQTLPADYVSTTDQPGCGIRSADYDDVYGDEP